MEREPLTSGFRFAEGLDIFKDRIVTAPEAADGLKRIAAERISWLDGLMEGREFLCGSRITLADVMLYCFLAFGKNVGQAYDEGNKNVHAWFERMSKRASTAV